MRDAALAAQAGTGAGNNLLAVGITVNLAPMFDVFRAPGDFIDQYAAATHRAGRRACAAA